MSGIHSIPPLLLALAHGVDAAELASTAGLAVNGCVVPLPPDAREPAQVLHHQDLVPTLRQHGLVVDRRSLVLRPAGRSDEVVVAQLAARPIGPAPVALLELHTPLLTAMHHGAASPTTRQAVETTGALLRRAADLLRRGDAADVWIVATGPARSVARTVDFEAALRRAFPPMLRRQFTCQVQPEVATIPTNSQRVRDLIDARLGEPPFSTMGHVYRGPAASGPLRFVPAAGIAFGTAPLFARAATPGTRALSARLPHPPRSRLPLDLSAVCARFWLAAAARLPQFEARQATVQAGLPQTPDLLWAMQRTATTSSHDAPLPLST